MTPKQFLEFNKNIQESINTSIEKNVNGKINNLTTEFKKYVAQDTEDKNKIFEWQNNATPYIESMKDLQGFKIVGTSVLKAILLIGSVTTAVYAFIKYLRN